MDLTAVQTFAKVVELGSFREAARRLGLPKSTVSRRVADLEERLGTRLLERTTRSMRLTDLGATYLQRITPAIDAMVDAERSLEELQAEPRGTLRLSVPLSFGHLFLGDILAGFLTAHPKVHVVAELSDRVVDLVDERFDVAIRAGALPDSSLVARKIGHGPLATFASPSYLTARGTPKRPEALVDHECLVFGTSPKTTWMFGLGRKRIAVKVSGRLAVNSFQTLGTLAAAGHGIARMAEYLGAEEVRRGRLVTILDRFAPPPVPLHLVYPSSRSLSASLRAFVEFVSAWMITPPWLA